VSIWQQADTAFGASDVINGGIDRSPQNVTFVENCSR
jgi:hypothetical protein